MNNIQKNIIIAITISFTLSACGLMQGMRSYNDYNTDMKSDEYSTYSWNPEKDYGNRGAAEADKAILAFFKGNITEAEQYVRKSLAKNPKQSYALLLGAIIYEQAGRPNRARQYYEDLMLKNAEETTILSSMPKITKDAVYNTARQRMKMLDIKQSTIVLENKETGVRAFNVNDDFKPEISIDDNQYKRTTDITQKQKPVSSDIHSDLFNDGERFVMSRFLTFSKLSEEGLITKKEFLSRRNANVGSLIPQTHKPAAIGLTNPVPSTDVIIDRLKALKAALEIRSITSREYAAERDLIIDAILPLESLARAKPVSPPTDILAAAESVRKLEVYHKLNLITDKEKSDESVVIEKLIKIGTSASTSNGAKPKLLIP